MTKPETIQIIAMIKTAYSKYYLSKNKNEVALQIDLWNEMFKDDPYEIVLQAVKALIYTLKFPPTIADVKEKINLITQPEELTEMEAWNLVLKAVKNSAYCSSEEFEKLPYALKKIVGTPNQLIIWGQMDENTVNSVIQSNVMRGFRAYKIRDKTYEALPKSTKEMIERLRENAKIGIKRVAAVDALKIKSGDC